MSFILALDQGTSSSRALLFDAAGRVVALARRKIAPILPRPGWVEQDPIEIWESQLAVAREALSEAGADAADLAAIGITNQRETTILWERSSGRPLSHAIVWQDRRTAEMCERLRSEGAEAPIRERTGLRLDPYFSGTKLRWLLEELPDARRLAESGRLAFGTVDAWLLWNLTGGERHVTDRTNACRTLLLDLRRLEWDDELLELLGIPPGVLPELCGSSEVVGETLPGLFGRAVPIAGIAGDQHAALFGHLCDRPGAVKNTYGTGCFALMHTGSQPVPSQFELLTTLGWQAGDETVYALEGSVFNGGTAVQWLRDGLGLIRTAPEVEALARQVPDAGGVNFVPAFTGLGAPHWDPHARGTLVGITRATTAAHLARATLEGIACQVADVVEAMAEDAGTEVPELRVDGGAAGNDLLLQLQADLLGVPVVRPANLETTAAGAAYLAGLAAGVWSDRAELAARAEVDRLFEPSVPEEEIAERRDGWRRAVERARGWSRE